MTKSVEPDKIISAMEEEYRLDGDDRTIWEAIDDIMRHVPARVLRRLPADGAEHHDHYLYGAPKKVPHSS